MRTASNSNQANQIESADEWVKWIAQRVRVRERTFDNEPPEMIAAYNREQRSTQEYHGREILELLQNADDAGVDYGRRNKAIISLSKDGVCVANTGIPFSKEGVQSLMLSDKSPKQLDRTQYIGNRGLGFRSILAWTHYPFIISGNLRLGFSLPLAASRLEALCAKNHHVLGEVQEMRQSGYSTPIPLLACPAFLDENGLATNLDPPANYVALWQAAVVLYSEGYDTVVGIPFTEITAYQEVVQQIDELRQSQDMLLFLQNLEELVICVNLNTQVWKVKRAKGRVRVTRSEDPEHPLYWRVFSRTGTIPKEHLERNQLHTPGFEIKIAVPLQDAKTGKLFNYFPTQVRFPYPIVAHATMDLTNNRQNLVDSKANRYLVGQLAEVLAESAESATVHNDPWLPLKSIAKRGDLDPMLERLGFERALLDAAKVKKLVPRRDGKTVMASDAKLFPENPEGWLPLEEFKDLVLYTGDSYLKQTLRNLGMESLGTDEFRQRLDHLSPRLRLQSRATLIAGLINAKNVPLPRHPAPRLLIDDKDKLIEAGAITYLLPTNQSSFDLPDWMPLRFVSPRLVSDLQDIMKMPSEQLATALGDFKVHSYHFGGLASAIMARVNERCGEEGADETAVRLDGLRVLKKLYDSSASDTSLRRRQDLKVRLLTRTGKWEFAEQLYLGDGYPNGNLMEALLGSAHPEQFAASPSQIAEDGKSAEWDMFFQWLGASALPREVSLIFPYYSVVHYAECVRRALQYPAQFGEYVVVEPKDLRFESFNYLTSIEHLEEILDKADVHAIIAWVANDSRIENWRNRGDVGARLSAIFCVRAIRPLTGQPVPSYVLWLLRERGWLPVMDGRKQAPIHCVNARISSEEVRRVFPQPAVSPDHPLLKQLAVDKPKLRAALERVGVCMSLDDLSWEQCYQVLLELPKVDPSGDAAPSFYRMLASKEEDINLDELPVHDTFQKEGKLWCQLGKDCAYRSVQERVFFVADATVPRSVVEIFPVLDLPRGRGTEKIHRVFGVHIIRAADVALKVTSETRHPQHELLNDAVSRLKPFAFAIRLDSNPDATGSSRLKNLQVIACSNIEASAHLGQQEIPILLNTAGESLICEDTAYLIMGEITELDLLHDHTIANSIANILSTILQIERTSDFARLAAAQQKDRLQLLSLILEHDGTEVYQRARETLALAEAEIELQLVRDVTPSDLFAASLTTEKPSDGVESKPPVTPPLISEKPTTPIPGSVTTKQIPLEQPKPKPKVSLRVQRRRGPPRVREGKPVTDGNRCEDLAMRFEEEQKRYPLLVGPIQGGKSWGCDILSFATDADRENFKTQLDAKCVQRFIEVKGRSSQSGPIPLEGNELKSAREQKERFFIYRVYEIVEGQEWQVAVLAHPLAHEWPVSYSVALFQCADTEYWSVEAVQPELHTSITDSAS